MKKTVSEKNKIPLHNCMPKALKMLTVSILCFSSISTVNAETLGQKAVYSINVLPWADAAEVGQCSTFTFDDDTTNVSTICADDPITNVPQRSHLEDNVSLTPALSGGDGVLDGFAGVITIQTGLADISGDNIFVVLSYQMDPYLRTPGGVFKTTMTEPDGANMGIGTVNAAGDMTLDLTGQTGVAGTFETLIGIQPWNIDDSIVMVGAGIPVTGLYDVMTTGNETNAAAATGSTLTDITGRAIGDANTDTILDAVLISAGNIGAGWTVFDGVPYSLAYNVQFTLVSADPVAVDDSFLTKLTTTLTIDIKTELININDTIADKTETLTYVSFDDTLTDAGSSVSEAGGIITYIPNPAFTDPSTDSFTYTITDGNGDTDTATVNITITNAGSPIANDDAVSATEDTPVTFDPVAGIVAGIVADSDPELSEIPNLTISTFDVVSLEGGAISQVGNDLTYTPAPEFNGVDTFTYTIQNSIPLTDTATVTVTVASVNDAPVCTDVVFITAVDTALDINIADELLSTTSVPPLCTDVDNDGITLTTFDPVSTSGGTVTSDGATLTYTPPAGFEGTDTFTFTATDGTDNADPNTVSVNVADPTLSNFSMLDKQGNTFGGTNDVEFEWDGASFNTDDKDTTTNATMASVSSFPFFGSPWFSHHIRIFRPGTYTFDTTCNKSDFDTGVTTCDRELTKDSSGNVIQTEQFLTVTVGDRQLGALVFFDWNTTEDIDVFLVWDIAAPWDTLGATAPKNQLYTGPAGLAPDANADWEMVSRDTDGDGIVGTAMIDGAFIGYSANFNIGPGGTAEPLPPITSEARDTSLDPSIFSINIWGLVVGLFSILGLRTCRKNK